MEHGKRPKDVDVPAYLPDCDEVRSDMLDYVPEYSFRQLNAVNIGICDNPAVFWRLMGYSTIVSSSSSSV